MSFFPVFSDVGGVDTESQIINYCDNKTLSAISCTQKYAYEQLPNNGIFFERFLELYKSVHPTPEKLFPHFQKNYPGCCWKICSCLYPEAQSIVVFEQKFLQEAQLVIDKENEKCNLEARLQTICGIGYGDPNSSIQRAWEAYRTFNENESTKTLLKRESNIFEVYDKLNKRTRTLRMSLSYLNEHSYDWGISAESIRKQKCEKELQTICGAEDGDSNSPLHKAWEAYLLVDKSNKELKKHLSTLYREYEDLKTERQTIVYQLDRHPDEMGALKKEVIIALLVDQYFAKNLNLLSSSHVSGNLLPSLVDMLVQILEKPGQSYNSSKLVQYMKVTLQMPPELSGMILEVLYHTCANGVSEDIPKHIQNLVFAGVGFAPNFSSSARGVSVNTTARADQEIWGASLANSQILNVFGYNWGTNHCGEYIPEMLSICERLLANCRLTS